jgi:LytS/YehU family sensor histidine kinase
LFNTLNAISSVMYEDVRKADAMLARLSEFLRAVLTTSQAQEITLDEELEIERMYVDVMQARLENALQLHISADPDTRMARVPPLILQPLIENAVRHGLTGATSAFEVRIDAQRCGATLELRVSDNGAGLRAETPTFGHGLKNVHSRLAQLHGAQAGVHITQLAPQGTEVCLVLPLHA